MAKVELGHGEAGDLFAEAISVKLVGISDDRDRRNAQAFAAFPMAYLDGPRGTLALDTPVDFTDVGTDFTARGVRAQVADIPDVTTLEVKVGDDRDAIVMDRREYFDYLRAIRDARGMTSPVRNKAYELARRLGILHRKKLARNLKRLDAYINQTANWHTSSTTLGNPWSNSATTTYSLLRDAFRVTKGDHVLMAQDNYDALIDSPDLKKRFYGQGESDRVLTRSLLTEALSEIAGYEVKIFVDSFSGNPELNDYLLGDFTLVFRGGADGGDDGLSISNGLDGIQRENAAAAFFARQPGDPAEMSARGEGFVLSNIPEMTDNQRRAMFGMEYIVNETQFKAENEVWHQLHSSYGFKIMKANGGVLFKAGAGR